MTTSTGVASDPIDLLDKYRLFLISDGYTVNRYAVEGSGYALNVQKSIGGRTAYFNFRSLVNEKLGTAPENIYGVAGNLSTGYNAGNLALEQPGSIGGNSCGFVEYSDLESYRFMADTDYTSMSCVNSSGEWQHGICSSTVTTYGQFWANHHADYIFSDITQRDTFMRVIGNAYVAGCAVYTGAEWALLRAYRDEGDPVLKAFFNIGNLEISYGLVPDILFNSPNDNIGIPVLIPMSLFAGRTDVVDLKHYDGPEGVKIVNKKFINNGQTITVGGSDYIVYKANPVDENYGVAFRIS
jgi:hypothetical protein